MEGKSKAEWLDSMLRRPQSKTHPDRTSEQSALLSMAVAKMEKNRKKLCIPQRDITIMRYLADNPRAVIVNEPNVRRAFEYAKKAVEL